MVVHGHGKDLFGLILTDHVLFEQGLDLLRRQETAVFELFLDVLLGHDVVAQGNAFVANVDVGPGDQPLHLGLGLAAKGAAQLGGIVLPAHERSLAFLRGMIP